MDPAADRTGAVDADAVALALGDVGVVTAIVGWGIVDHNGLAGLAEPGEVVGTIGPFLAGFLGVALLAGTYAPERRATLVSSVRNVAVAWVGGVGIGLVVRTSPVVDGGATWPFGLVVTGTVLLGLLAWRVGAYALLARWSELDQPARG